MSETRKKMGGRKAVKESMSQKEPPSKLEKKILHWVRRNVPTKKTKFLHSHVVEYFTGCKAVDALVNDSPWAKDNVQEDSEIKFITRESAIEYMDDMLKHKMFHRAKKIPVMEKEKKKKKTAKGDKTDTEKEDQEEVAAKGQEVAAKKEDEDGSKKKKRKIRLDMHLEQVFIDTQDAYVWLYDPIPWYYWVGGSAIVLGIIAVCLFPLWPPMMRKGVHYLSIAAAGFLIFIIALGLLKYVIFGLLFALSTGKLRFWIFPNLTEDVGFFESFVPLYDYTYTGASKKKDKDSDDEEEDDEEEEENEQDENNKAETNNSESDESTSKKSSTGKDFEIVDKNDTDTQED